MALYPSDLGPVISIIKVVPLSGGQAQINEMRCEGHVDCPRKRSNPVAPVEYRYYSIEKLA
jgi:hypothetical protein